MICKKDTCLAICQMGVLNTVLTIGGMDMEQAIRYLQLDKEKYAILADIEELPEMAVAIRKVIKDKVRVTP